MSNDTRPQSRERPRLRLSQETIAIVTVGVALAGLNLVTVSDLRDEARADRAAWQAESRQLRDEAQADRDRADARAQADRDRADARAQADRDRADARFEAFQDRADARFEAFQDRTDAQFEAFQREILRLTEGQAKIAAIVETDQ